MLKLAPFWESKAYHFIASRSDGMICQRVDFCVVHHFRDLAPVRSHGQIIKHADKPWCLMISSSGHLKHGHADDTGGSLYLRFDRRHPLDTIVGPVPRNADAPLIGFDIDKPGLRRQIE